MKAEPTAGDTANKRAMPISRLDKVYMQVGYLARTIRGIMRLKKKYEVLRPSIAAVTVGRNDDYMPDFHQRLNATIEWNSHHLSLKEFIFVEWNPPVDRELLSFDLAKRFKHLRAYVVPSEVHRILSENPNVPLMEYHAKNVGIRRAMADYIIATNADTAFGPDTIFSALYLLPELNTIMTAQRIEVEWPGPKRTYIRFSDFLRYKNMYPYVPVGTGEFLLASKDLWERVRGYDESLVRHRDLCDYRGAAQMLAHGANAWRAGVVLHLSHPTSVFNGLQPHHGEQALWLHGLPYCNNENWGIGNAREIQLSERVWRLEI